MGFAGEFYSSIIEHVSGSDVAETIKKIWDALDPGKWGSPLTEGEAHYVNDVIVDEFYGTAGDEKTHEHRNAVTLAEVYGELDEDFAYLRRGWLADYMGDAFAQNAFQKLQFTLFTRTGQFGEALRETVKTAEQSPSAPSGIEGKIWAVVWATFFFHFATLTFAEVTGFTRLTELWIVWPTLLGLYICYIKWYGKYGMYLPIFGSQSVPSAITAVALLVTTIRIGVDVAGATIGLIPFVPALSIGMFPEFFHPTQIPVIGYGIYLLLAIYVVYQFILMIRVIAIPLIIFAPITFPLLYSAWVFVRGALQSLMIPQPLFLGTYPLISNLEWGSLLVIWGIAGLANIYYAEWEENQTEMGEEIHAFKRVMDQELEHFKNGGGS